MRTTSMFTKIVFLATVCVVFWGCKKKEEEEETDPVMGVWNTECTRLFSDEEVIDKDMCNDVDAVEGQDPGEENSTDCNAKYGATYFIDTLTFREAGAAIDLTTGKALTGDAAAEHNQAVYSRKTYSDDECTDLIATLDRAFSFQDQPRALQEDDDPAGETADRFADKAVAINFQMRQAALSYHEDAGLDTYQNALTLCQTDDWEADTVVDITDKNNCWYTDYMLTDKLGGDTGVNLGVTGSVTITSTVNPPALTYFAGLGEGEDDYMLSSFISGEEFYTVYYIDDSKAKPELSIGNFFDTLPFGMPNFNSKYSIDDDEVDTTAAHQDGDNDNHRQIDFTSTFIYDADATAEL
jgi:hypothetical protein